jgi:predicted nucleic acid-binding protein
VTVVSNTTPLNYLILIEEHELAGRLYGHVLIPSTVLLELRAPLSPAAVRAWALSPPDWLEVRDPRPAVDPLLVKLQAGERDAIHLAGEIGADMLLMDERAGRRAARGRGLRTTGTLALLMDAGWQGLVDFEISLERLLNTSFYVTDAVLQDTRARYAAGRGNG